MPQIFAHGCGGITGSEIYWARSLRELGIATLLVNSFSGRGYLPDLLGQPSISLTSVLSDVYRALLDPAVNPDAARIRVGRRPAFSTSRIFR
jgi:hypothetical protein